MAATSYRRVSNIQRGENCYNLQEIKNNSQNVNQCFLESFLESRYECELGAEAHALACAPDAGQVFDISHLHPFRYSLKLPETSTYPAREVDVRVGFSSHTFTRSCEHDEEPHAAYSRENDPRMFCHARYALSKRVPDVIRKLDGRDCLYGNRDNYLVIELPGIISSGF